MKFSVLTVAVLMCLGMSGCTRYWYQEGKSFQDCLKDYKDCRGDLKTFKDTGQVDAGVYAHRFEEECMKEKGYELVGEGTLPDRVKRVSTMNDGQPYGIAGSVD